MHQITFDVTDNQRSTHLTIIGAMLGKFMKKLTSFYSCYVQVQGASAGAARGREEPLQTDLAAWSEFT